MLSHIVAAALCAVASVSALQPDLHRELLLAGRPRVALWKALQGQEQLDASRQHEAQKFVAAPTALKYTAHCFEQPISHFDESVNGTFCQRYWVDASAYKPGGPVFLLDGGETSGANRLPFLEKGILNILSNATGGLSIVLEHRYYGKSVPVSSFSTDNLRFLNNAEALEDSAHFIENFRLPASHHVNPSHSLHPNSTAWIYYGGSYAGARAAHMRTQYPHLIWGAIASSAVTHAQVNFPEYFAPIQEYAPQSCIAAIRSSVKVIDTILDAPGPAAGLLKGLFGLQELEDDDFAEVLQSPLGYWQEKNWDPKVGSDRFREFCDALLTGGAGSKLGVVRIPTEVVNYAKYIKEHVVSQCPAEAGVVECFGSHDDAKFREDGLDQEWRLWLFQVCTQWGYFMPAPLQGPSILSKRLTLEHSSKICKQAFPPGKHFTVPEWPDVDEVNRRGDYAIEADRLAFIDGDRDPWRPMTPQADAAPKKDSTSDRPRHIIFDGVHHYDENGLDDHDQEPDRIRAVHALEVDFVKRWVKGFDEQRRRP